MGEGFSEYGGGPGGCVDVDGIRGLLDIGIAGDGAPYEDAAGDGMPYEGCWVGLGGFTGGGPSS